MNFANRVFGIVVTLLLGISIQVAAQDDLIPKRQKLMKSNSAANKAIKSAVGKKDYAAVEAKAKEIANNMGQLEALFPKGSTSDKSRAKAAIWEKWDEFTKDAEGAKMAANDLAAAAAAKDEAEVGAKFKVLGKSCGGCHKPFRAPKKK
ncbi:MAG: cytochrome c [Deltaproteobacteria bacterium]|nr:cytochrome c [Deltaproteobacteria bacterium]